MPLVAGSTLTPPVIAAAGPLLAKYDVLFCDIWGVLHDGIRAFNASNDALLRFRAGGGTVVLVSNAPAPVDAVAGTLAAKGVVREAYDAIVSSGELALAHIDAAGFRRVHRIGPGGRDAAFFRALKVADAALADCDAIACTGLVDDVAETARAYRARLEAPAARRVPFVCANPDLVVHVGDRLLPCAGAIAAVYEELGGPVVWSGKPYRSAYERAFAKAAAVRGAEVSPSQVLAIGDAVRTDLAGAEAAGIAALFITSGIHRDEVMQGAAIDQPRLEQCLRRADVGCAAAMPYLVW